MIWWTTCLPVSGSVHSRGSSARVLRRVLHHHDHVLRPVHEVHRAAHAFDQLAGSSSSRDRRRRDLHRAEHGGIDVSAADIPNEVAESKNMRRAAP